MHLHVVDAVQEAKVGHIGAEHERAVEAQRCQHAFHSLHHK